MTSTCINGAGFAGLATALLLAADGHDVTVVERDPAPPSRDPEVAWTSWERRAVPQFRQTHAFLALTRQLLTAELPHVWTRLLEAGVTEHNLATHPPLTIADRAHRPGDDDLVYVNARRSTVEHVLRHAAEDDPRVEVLSGVAAKGLLTEGDGPRVVGLATSAGPLEADLVVDCGGRRTPVPDWVEDAGGPRPGEESAEYRIAYWTQWFRLRPGAEMPVLYGRPALEVGPMEVLRVPADNGWFSITIVAVASDRRFRVLSDQARLLRFLAALPLTRDWVDPALAEPVGGIVPMVTLVDCRRRLVVDGRPCASGLVAVGDSVGASNPSLARGTAFGLLHAVGLRDLLRDDPDPATILPRHAELLEERFEPWWQATVATDQAHLARMRAAAEGSEPAADPGWTFLHAAHHDADLWRLALRVAGVLELAQDVVARPGTLERVGETIGRVGPPRVEAIDVDALLAA